jgi:hypothetical protein
VEKEQSLDPEQSKYEHDEKNNALARYVERIERRTHETADTDPIRMSLTTGCTLDLEYVVVGGIRGVDRPQICDSSRSQ